MSDFVLPGKICLPWHPWLFVFLIVVLDFCSVKAQTQAGKVQFSGKRQYDTSYVQRYSDKIVAKLDVDSDVDQYLIQGSNFKYDIRPNAGVSKLLSFNYRYAYLAVSYLPSIIAPNRLNDQRGETSGFGVGTGLSTPRLVADISYKKVKGFYLHNTGDVDPGWDSSSDPYIQFPEMKTWMIRGVMLYKVNPNYSVRAIQTQTEAQRKSATSLIPGIASTYYVIDNQSASSSSSQKSNTLEVLAELNYYGTLVINHRLYFSAGLGAGAGMYHTWLLTRQPTGNIGSTQSNSIFRGIGNAGLGYNANRFIAGAEILHYQSFSSQPNDVVQMKFTRTAFQVFIGYRFKPPRFIEKTMDGLDHLFSF